MAVIIRYYPESKTWPERAEPINRAEAEELVEAGKATREADGIYRTRVMTPEKKVVTPEPAPVAEADDDPLAQECPKCGAGPGEECITPKGKKTGIHAARSE